MLNRSSAVKSSSAIIAGAAALALWAGLFGATPVRAQTIELRMHTHVPPVSSSFKNLTWWKNKVEKESGGRLKITLFGSNQLGGKAEDIYDQVKSGVVDIGWTLPGYKAGLFPVTSAFELPFIGDIASVNSAALDPFVRKYAQKEWGDVHMIVAHSAGVSVLHMKTRKIEKLEDFKGLKIRTPSRISSAALGALGATPVPIPGLKITEALMHDVVDGAVAPWAIARAIRTIDVAKYHTENTLHGPTLAMVMNKQSYAKLPPDLQKVIDANSGQALAKHFGELWEKDDMPGRAKAKELHHEIIVLSAAEQARWKKASQPVYDDWIKEMDGKGYNGRELVDAAEGLIAKAKTEAKTN
jgi:TRAP-type transport system periplasmic protein